jgi:hypothetical protein
MLRILLSKRPEPFPPSCREDCRLQSIIIPSGLASRVEAFLS